MFKVDDSLYSKIPPITCQVGNSTTITAGMLLYEDNTNGIVKPVTSSAGTVENIIGIATQSVTTTGGTTSTVKVNPVDHAVYVIADCTNATATNQLHKNHIMTDANNVNNTSTSIATTAGIFHAINLSGATTNTPPRLYGYFIRTGQVSS